MDIDERKVDEEVLHETYPYEYVQLTALKMRELELESELGHASEAEKRPIETQLEYVRAKLKRLAAIQTRFVSFLEVSNSVTHQPFLLLQSTVQPPELDLRRQVSPFVTAPALVDDRVSKGDFRQPCWRVPAAFFAGYKEPIADDGEEVSNQLQRSVSRQESDQAAVGGVCQQFSGTGGWMDCSSSIPCVGLERQEHVKYFYCVK